MRIKLVLAGLAALLIGSVLAAAPASATPTNILLGAINTGVSTDCTTVGTAPTSGPVVNAHHSNVAELFTPSALEVQCVTEILAFMKAHIRDIYDEDVNYTSQLQAELFSGDPNLEEPYEVFL